jgi:hypothetical protein
MTPRQLLRLAARIEHALEYVTAAIFGIGIALLLNVAIDAAVQLAAPAPAVLGANP